MNKWDRIGVFGMLLCFVLALWFCIAALWKTTEVGMWVFKKVSADGYHKTMDRMDAAVERFWKGR